MTAPEDQHLAALQLFRGAFAILQVQDNIPTAVRTMIAEAEAIMKKAPFEFFGLPPELRDMTYDECLGDRQNEYNEDIRLQYAIKKTNTLKFICTQFQNEYKERALAQQYLFLFDPGKITLTKSS